jgi:hypothetical protein
MATTKAPAQPDNQALVHRIIAVQSELKAPKGQYNSFGKYAYRNAEDILEAVKPLLTKNGLSMNISDSVHEVAGMIYVQAEVRVTDGIESAVVTAQAGIDPSRKGMDIAQSFGASSSYARKYALNGMFLIDDTKDADATNTHGKTEQPKAAAPVGGSDTFQQAVDYIKGSSDKAKAYSAIVGKYGSQFSEKQIEALKKFVG